MILDQDFMDPDRAEALLNLTVGDKLTNAESLIKSFYEFDFADIASITTFLTVLPLMDVEVVKQAAAELFPSSVQDESFDLSRARFELRAYLTDIAEMLVAGDE